MWEKWGLKENPYSQYPIGEYSLDLFVGREKEINKCKTVLSGRNARIIIEGGRGVGTTSFANYARFTSKNHLTPDIEISVKRDWGVEMLITNVLSAIVQATEKKCPKVKNNKEFLRIKRSVHVIEETYKTIGLQAYVLGGQFGESKTVTLPPTIPNVNLIMHMKELSKIIRKNGFSNGAIIHLNNLDLGTVLEKEELKKILNDARDIFLIEGYCWLLVGDTGLKGFISSQVDRLDDVISADIEIVPLSLKNIKSLILRRLEHYAFNKNKVTNPINDDVVEYLYDITNGRLRYIFGVCTNLLSLIAGDAVIKTIDLAIAKPLIVSLAKEKIDKKQISPTALNILGVIVEKKNITTMKLANTIKMKHPNVSRSIKELVKAGLVKVEEHGRINIYSPSLDAKIGYDVHSL